MSDGPVFYRDGQNYMILEAGGNARAATEIEQLLWTGADEAARAVNELRRQLASTIEERDRYIKRMRVLEDRAQHAEEVLSGKFLPPEIDEIRRVRHLDPL